MKIARLPKTQNKISLNFDKQHRVLSTKKNKADKLNPVDPCHKGKGGIIEALQVHLDHKRLYE